MGELRVRKIQEFIKQEVSNIILRELKDPRIGFITVTDARITAIAGSDGICQPVWQRCRKRPIR